jgi:ABC-type sugar transport system permease subunit
VAEAGGYTSGENTSADPAHPTESTASLQFKIPVAAYPATLAKLASQLGTQVSLQQQAQDVTQQVADTSSRVASDEAAITQLRVLLARTGSVADLLSVQNQINSEESDLESMQAQQRALNAETAYATVSLSLLGPLAKPTPPRHLKPPPGPGLVAGLTAGWHALRLTLSWLLAVLGAVIPLGVVLALIAYLAYRGRRWLMRRHTRPTSEPTSD